MEVYMIEHIITTLSSIGTFIIAYLTFKLQKTIKEEKDQAKKDEYSRHASDIYYFIHDILYKKDNSSFNNVIVDGKEYMQDINYIRYKYISNKEFELLRKIYILYDNKDYKLLSELLNNKESINKIINKLESIMDDKEKKNY